MSTQAPNLTLSDPGGDLEFYATCGAGLAHLLADECMELGFSQVQTAGAGVRFRGPLAAGYKACLWSRVANRILLPVTRGPAADPDALYRLVQTIDWNTHVANSGSLAVDFFTANSAITHSQYGALKVKDAIVDQFRDQTGQRPDVDRDTPDIRVNVYLFRDTARIAIDLSGSSLHRRGYRLAGGLAPLKENLAAAILLASDWPVASQRGEALYDPMCGSGTLLIEAAMIATRRAPGLYRDYFGFLGWKQHDAALWDDIRQEASASMTQTTARIAGTDHDAGVIETCQSNIEQAGLSSIIDVAHHRIEDGRPASLFNARSGTIVSNPPYGERLATDPAFYQSLGTNFSRHLPGWTCALFTAQAAPYARLRLPLRSALSARNGGIDCVLMLGSIPGNRQRESSQADAQPNIMPADATEVSVAAAGFEPPSTVHPQAALYRKAQSAPAVDATPFVNRLRKNQKAMKGWIKQNSVQAYRLYDSDLPEFAVAIDVFKADRTHCVVQEYQAPDTVNVAMAQARLSALLQAIPGALDIAADYVHLKVRQVQQGKDQYEKLQAGQSQVAMVEEFGAQLEVNFTDYLDVGLFLDHRPVRRHLFQHSQGKRFLNLFAYTASATVAAAQGGAASSVSVDSSNRYCQWARRNLDRNGAAAQLHEVVRQDVLGWLSDAAMGLSPDRHFDIILLDPPTFSNSTDQSVDWNLQRDHVAAIDACLKQLVSGGLLIFSNNYRRFKLDQQALCDGQRQIQLEDRNRWSIDRDFQRNQRIHQCWFIYKQ